MRPIHLPPLTPLQHKALDHLYRTTKAPRLRTRAQMVLLSVGQRLKVHQIAAIVRESEATVLRWLKRYRPRALTGYTMRRALGRPRGQQVMIPPPGQPSKRDGLGAVNYHTGATVVLFRRRKRRREVAELWQALVDKHPTGTL
jgi:Homeodomain-like domain